VAREWRVFPASHDMAEVASGVTGRNPPFFLQNPRFLIDGWCNQPYLSHRFP
jgi:hypothetical protein